jgi:hypothetical protein
MLALRDSSTVERGTVNPQVPGSNPGRGALKFTYVYFFDAG